MQLQLTPKYNLADIVISVIKTVTIVSISAVVTIVAAKMVGGASLSVNQVSTQKSSTFDVNGESEISVIPDEATVNLGIQVNERTVAQAQNKINQTINSISASLKDLGIEKDDIKTRDYNIYPNYDYSRGAQSINGYNASTTLVVKVTDFEKLNQAIDTATSLGANTVSGISFGLSDEKTKEVEKQAREEAIEDAKDKAKELAKLSGMKLGKIVNVYESNVSNYPVYAYDRAEIMMDGKGGGAPTNVEPGSTSYSFSVTLSYETL